MAASASTEQAALDETAPLLPSDETAPLTQGEDQAIRYNDLNQTVFNMINCFVGAGILTVPFAFRLAGYSAALCLLLVACLNWYTSLLLGKALDRAALLHPEVPQRNWTMGALGGAAFGPWGDRGIRVLFALELWFALETFLVLTGISAQLLTGLPEAPIIFVAGVLGCVSLGLPMRAISMGSLLAVACMVAGLLALIICGVGRLKDHADNLVPAEQHHTMDLHRLPASIGIFLYCFSGLPCLPNIRASMQRPKEDYPKAIHCSFIFSFFYYLAIGFLGYLFFANDTRRSFLKDLEPLEGEGHAKVYGWIAAVAAGLFALKLQAGFPLYASPILEAMGLSPEDSHAFANLTNLKLWLARSLFTAISVAFAIFARHQIDAIAELMGAFLTNSTSIIFPVAAYCSLKARGNEKMEKGQVAGLSAMLMFGVIYGLIGTFTAVHSMWYGKSVHVGGAELGYSTAAPTLAHR